jgi:hypothetical protein
MKTPNASGEAMRIIARGAEVHIILCTETAADAIEVAAKMADQLDRGRPLTLCIDPTRGPEVLN